MNKLIQVFVKENCEADKMVMKMIDRISKELIITKEYDEYGEWNVGSLYIGSNKYNVYYSHHIWKYNTNAEKLEIEIIKNLYSNANIINPNGFVYQEAPEEAIMNQCLSLVGLSDIVIFSSLDGIIGKGVYREIESAINQGKYLQYLNNGNIIEFTKEDFKRIELINKTTKTERLYGRIYEK